MDFILAELARHGYAILFVSVFLEAVGFPVPAAIALLLAGAASAHGSLSALATVGGAFGVILICDNLMFLFGRYSGWWLLGLLCRFTLNPESCILRSADAFYKRGRALLVFAKFVPGINTMAPPLSGQHEYAVDAVRRARRCRRRPLRRRVLVFGIPVRRCRRADHQNHASFQPGSGVGRLRRQWPAIWFIWFGTGPRRARSAPSRACGPPRRRRRFRSRTP